MKQKLLSTLFTLCFLPIFSQVFNPSEYCLVWSDEFDVDGLPNSANWRYETGYSIRNNEAQNYTANRLENARVENGRLIIEARKDNYQGHEISSASLVTWGKVVYQYGRFECRAKVDTRSGSWPAFWTLGEKGEWPSNGEIDIMEYYNGKILGNAAWGTETRWSAKWDSQTIPISQLGSNFSNEFHVFMMEWEPNYIRLYVDNILINEVNLANTINGSLGNYTNPFKQPHYLLINQAIGGNNGGSYANTTFPIKYEIDYVRIYQKGNCNLDCNWDQNGTAYQDECLQCVGGNTTKDACVLNCNGNLIANPNFEINGLSSWTGWGTRSISTDAYEGINSVMVGNGAAEQVVNVNPNTNYILAARVKKSGGGAAFIGVKEHGSAETSLRIDNNTWQEKTLSFRTGNSSTARIYYYNPEGGNAFADNFVLVPQGCSITANESLEEQKNFSIFPNPSSHNFYINCPKNSKIEVFNSNGELIEVHLNTNENPTIGSNLISGLYLVKITFEDTIDFQRIIKVEE